MRGVSKTTIIGYCGKDPEQKTFANGGSVTRISVATTETWTDKKGEAQSHTEWHNVVFKDKLGEIAAKYLRKGAPVYIEGANRTRKYEKDGNTFSVTEIRGWELNLLGDKPENAAAPSPAAEQRAADTGFNGPEDVPF